MAEQPEGSVVVQFEETEPRAGVQMAQADFSAFDQATRQTRRAAPAPTDLPQAAPAPDPFAAFDRATQAATAPTNPYEVTDWKALTPAQARERLQAIPAYDAEQRQAYDALPFVQKLTTAPPPGLHPNVREATLQHLQDIAQRDQEPASGAMEPHWLLDAPQLLTNMYPQAALAGLAIASKGIGRGVRASTEAVTASAPAQAVSRWLAPYGEAASTITQALTETPAGQTVTRWGRGVGRMVHDLHSRMVPTFLRSAAKEASYPIRHYSAQQRLDALRAEVQMRDGMAVADRRLAEIEQAWHDAWMARYGTEPDQTVFTPRPSQQWAPAPATPPPVSPLWEGAFKYGYIPEPEIPVAERASWLDYAISRGYQPPGYYRIVIEGQPSPRSPYGQLLTARQRLRALRHTMPDQPTPEQLGLERGLVTSIQQLEQQMAESAYQFMMHARPLDPRLQDYIPAAHKPLPFEITETDPILHPPAQMALPPSQSTRSGEPLWLTRQDADQALTLARQRGYVPGGPLQEAALAQQESLDRVWQDLLRPGGPDAGAESRLLTLLRDEDRLARDVGQEALTWLLDHDLQGMPEDLARKHPYGGRLLGDPLPAHRPGYKGTPKPTPTNVQRHFYDSLEHGLDKYSPELEQKLRAALEARYAELRKLPREWQEDYLWHHWTRGWKDPGKAERILEEVTENSHIPTSYRDQLMTSNVAAMWSDLSPRAGNPVAHILGQLRELDAFLMPHRALKAQQELGLVRYVSSSEPVPEGWKALPDAVAESLTYVPGQRAVQAAGQGLETAGQWYAPEEVAQIWNNWTSRGLLRDHVWYERVRQSSNAMVQLRLSISGFHAVAESLYAMTSDLALGMMQLSEGRVGPGTTSLARGLNPWSVKWTFQEGRKGIQEAMFPGSMPPEIAEMVANLTRGGMDFQRGLYHRAAPTAAGNMWRQMQGHPLLAMVEKISEPLMSKFVPAVKVGAAMRLAQEELARLGPGATEQQIRAAMARVVDSIDNRFGLLAYDNLFWNRTLKDLAHVMVQSPGWNLGWIREGGGAVFDMGKALSGTDPVLSSRTAFTMALPFVVGIYGGVMHFLMTGKHPETLQDYYYPQTGTVRGKYQERLKLPSYMHDMASVVHGMSEKSDLVGWSTGKLNPLLTTAYELVRNTDYFGLPIRGEHGRQAQSLEGVLTALPDDVQGPLRSLYQTIVHVADAYVPFSAGQEWRAAQHGDLWEVIGGLLGITSAPGWAKESAGQRERRQLQEGRRIDQHRQRLENR